MPRYPGDFCGDAFVGGELFELSNCVTQYCLARLLARFDGSFNGDLAVCVYSALCERLGGIVCDVCSELDSA